MKIRSDCNVSLINEVQGISKDPCSVTMSE